MAKMAAIEVDHQQLYIAGSISCCKILTPQFSEQTIQWNYQRRVPLAFISILPGIHANHTEKWGVPLVMYGG